MRPPNSVRRPRQQQRRGLPSHHSLLDRATIVGNPPEIPAHSLPPSNLSVHVRMICESATFLDDELGPVSLAAIERHWSERRVNGSSTLPAQARRRLSSVEHLSKTIDGQSQTFEQHGFQGPPRNVGSNPVVRLSPVPRARPALLARVWGAGLQRGRLRASKARSICQAMLDILAICCRDGVFGPF